MAPADDNTATRVLLETILRTQEKTASALDGYRTETTGAIGELRQEIREHVSETKRTQARLFAERRECEQSCEARSAEIKTAVTRHVDVDHHESPWYGTAWALLWRYRGRVVTAAGAVMTATGIVLSALYPGGVGSALRDLGGLVR